MHRRAMKVESWTVKGYPSHGPGFRAGSPWSTLRYLLLRVSTTSVNRFWNIILAVIRYTRLRLLLIRSAIVFGRRWSGISGTCLEVVALSAGIRGDLVDARGKNLVTMDRTVR